MRFSVARQVKENQTDIVLNVCAIDLVSGLENIAGWEFNYVKSNEVIAQSSNIDESPKTNSGQSKGSLAAGD
jgi:hypothetical protein